MEQTISYSRKYIIEYLEDANKDLDYLFNVIVSQYKAPLTAFKYMRELRKTIDSLEVSAEAYAIQTRHCFRKYGDNVRRLNYKKMAVIYTVHGDTVYIHRIVPAATITGI